MGDGTLQSTDLSASNISWCSSGWYWLLAGCWGLSQDAWQQAGALPQLTSANIPLAAPPAVPAGSTTTNPSVDDAESQINDSLNSMLTQYQQNVAAEAATLPDTAIPDAACTFLNIPCTWLLLGAAGAVLIFAAGRK